MTHSQYNSGMNMQISQNQRLAEKLEFAPEELAINKAGLMSERQQKVLRTTVQLRRASRSFAIVFFLLSLGVLWIVGYSLMQEEQDSLKSSVQYNLIVAVWISVGIVLAVIFGVFIWLDRSRAAELRAGIISVAEGPAHLSMKEIKGARMYGMLAHYISVGGVEFQLLGAKQYSAFDQGSKYRIFYIKNPPTQTIMSAEWLP